MTRNKLYLLLFAALTAGYTWLAWFLYHGTENPNINTCIFKQTTGYACPSCGNTRALREIIKGDIINALLINPLGIIIAIILIVFPLWLLYDIVFSKATLFKAYKNFEKTLKVKWVAFILVFLIIINWIWNIYKNL